MFRDHRREPSASKVVVSWPVLWIDTPIPEIWLLHIISRNHDSTFGIAKPGIYNSELQPKREICKQVLESTTSGSQLILLNGMDLNYKSWVIIAAALTNLATWHPNTASRQQICRDKFASRFWNQEYNKLASWIPTNQTLPNGSQQQELNYHRCRKEESWNLDIEFSKLATELKKNFLNDPSKLADAYHAPGSQ
jgi:hypothetical protein